MKARSDQRPSSWLSFFFMPSCGIILLRLGSRMTAAP
jgi:hypothetical protein